MKKKLKKIKKVKARLKVNEAQKTVGDWFPNKENWFILRK